MARASRLYIHWKTLVCHCPSWKENSFVQAARFPFVRGVFPDGRAAIDHCRALPPASTAHRMESGPTFCLREYASEFHSYRLLLRDTSGHQVLLEVFPMTLPDQTITVPLASSSCLQC